jgi:hypothetical protein
MEAGGIVADLGDSGSKQQVKHHAMRKELWPRFAEFRDGFVEQLATFANDSFYVGTKRITMPVIDVRDDGWEDLHITLNFQRLRLVYPTRLPMAAAQVTEETDTGEYIGAPPAFEIRIYEEIGAGSRLYGAVQAGYHGEGTYTYHIWQRMGAKMIRKLGNGQNLSRETGRQAAMKLIRHFYSLKSR